MSDISVDVLEAKLDILIEDFQRFRSTDRENIKQLYEELHGCNEEIAKIKTTLEWYKGTVALITGAIASVIAFKLKQ